MGVTRLRLDAQGPSLVECAAALDKASAFCLERRYAGTLSATFSAPNAPNANSVFGHEPVEMESLSLFDNDTCFIEDVYESKIRPADGSIYYVGRRVIGVDSGVRDEAELRLPLDGLPSVPSVPISVEVCGTTSAIAVSVNASVFDVVEAISETEPWKKYARIYGGEGRFSLVALNRGDTITLYEGTVPPGHGNVLVAGSPLWFAEMQPLWLSSIDDEVETQHVGPELVNGCLFSPARSHRQGDGLAIDIVVSGAQTNVWVSPDVTAMRAAEIAADVQGYSLRDDWELRSRMGSPVSASVSATSAIRDALTPLYFNSRPGVGG